jgi:hypothetical protein
MTDILYCTHMKNCLIFSAYQKWRENQNWFNLNLQHYRIILTEKTSEVISNRWYIEILIPRIIKYKCTSVLGSFPSVNNIYSVFKSTLQVLLYYTVTRHLYDAMTYIHTSVVSIYACINTKCNTHMASMKKHLNLCLIHVANAFSGAL